MARFDPQVHQDLSALPGEDEQWQKVWRLVVDAEQKPEKDRRSFVLRAGADPFVSRQTLAILEGTDSLISYLPEQPAELTGNDSFATRAGTKFGRYRIGTLLGSGATSSVYAGFDEELNRAVAIKFFSSGRDRSLGGGRALPVREARAASALNHPNIIMIHEVIETGDVSAIVMELVAGVTLRTLAASSPPLSEILHWTGQLARALAVAHANRLIHGDIKPDNVMVREDGYVKLLDFGLALPSLPDGRPGSYTGLTGTPRYLSPEQCAGQPASAASEIFSFGVMLYELTTGQRPFRAEGMLVLLQTIISSDVQRPDSLNRKLPGALSSLIVRMLSKQPSERPTAAQVAQELAAIRSRLEKRQQPFRSRALFLAAGVLTLAGASLVIVSRRSHDYLDLARMNVRPLASQPGLETNPSISPDGRWVSCLYRAHTNERPQFQVHATQGGPPFVIDTGQLQVEQSAAWSPDSKSLSFVAVDASGRRAVYLISRTGGAVSKVIDCLGSAGCDVDWSPDAPSLALTDQAPHHRYDQLSSVEVSTGRRRVLLEPDYWITSPRFSPDGKWIAFSHLTSLTKFELCMIPSAGGIVHCATGRSWWLSGFGWNRDSKSLIAMAGPRSERAEIWQLSTDGAFAPHRVAAFDFGRGGGMSVSRRTGAIAWVRDFTTANIWRMPAAGQADPAEPLVSSAASDSDPEYASDGRIAFVSDRSGTREAWIAREDGTGQVQATRFRDGSVGDPHWSPDARKLAFTVHRDNHADLYVVSCDGNAEQPCGPAKQLTDSHATDANPTWSSDGRRLYFSSNRSGSFELWTIRAEGGEPQRITRNGGYVARESADGKWLYYSKIDHGNGFWRQRRPADGQQQKEEVVVANTPFRAAATWALGVHDLFYYPSEEATAVSFPAVRAVDLETGRWRDLATNHKILGRGLSLSADNRWLLRTEIDRAVSVIMIGE